MPRSGGSRGPAGRSRRLRRRRRPALRQAGARPRAHAARCRARVHDRDRRTAGPRRLRGPHRAALRRRRGGGHGPRRSRAARHGSGGALQPRPAQPVGRGRVAAGDRGLARTARLPRHPAAGRRVRRQRDGRSRRRRRDDRGGRRRPRCRPPPRHRGQLWHRLQLLRPRRGAARGLRRPQARRRHRARPHLHHPRVDLRLVRAAASPSCSSFPSASSARSSAIG